MLAYKYLLESSTSISSHNYHYPMQLSPPKNTSQVPNRQLLRSVSLFGDSPSPQPTITPLPPLNTHRIAVSDRAGINQFDPDCYDGQGSGTGVFLSHVFVPPLPSDSTVAHYLKPHPRVLSRMTRTSTPSMLFQDDDSPPPISSRTSMFEVTQPSLSPISSASTIYQSFADLLNSSTAHNSSQIDTYSHASHSSKRPTKTHPPRHRKQTFNPGSYEGKGSGTGIFFSHILVPPLPTHSRIIGHSTTHTAADHDLTLERSQPLYPFYANSPAPLDPSSNPPHTLSPPPQNSALHFLLEYDSDRST
ncbi:hypothetical protein C8R42DRAFT_729459 [Lentinula raphanica]|nr:hypothetical protein C8R42DRAFT_729459 [Lentinula raphanica]